MAGWKPAGEPDWILISEAAEVPGADATLVARWIDEGHIHTYGSGDAVRVRRSEVQRMVTLTNNPAALGG